MKIAIAATSLEADAQIDERGARAPCYHLVDTETGLTETLANHVAESERKAGPRAATFLISRGVDQVIAGDFGNRFSTELENAGVVCVQKTGPVSQLLSDLKS